MKKEVVISPADLEAVIVECGTCGSQTRIRMDAPKITGARCNPYEGCAVCGATIPFDSTLRGYVEGFREAVKALKEHSNVSLQVSAVEAQPQAGPVAPSPLGLRP